MAEATDSDGSAQLSKSSANSTSATMADGPIASFEMLELCKSSADFTTYQFAAIPIVQEKRVPPSKRSHAETSQHPRSPQLSQQEVENEVTLDWNIMIQDHGDVVLLPDCTCCRVPTILRGLKEKAYTPKVVSIGPFHHGNDDLQDMERFKQTMFQRFTHRARSSREDLVRFVQHLEPKVRACYPKTINITKEQELVNVILQDAVFIIELFIMSYESTKEGGNNDAILIQPWLGNSVLFDLLLLENQLPFFLIEELFNKVFLIEELFNKVFPSDRRGCLPSFLELTYAYFKCHNKQKLKPDPDVKIKHFTDLLRLFYLEGNMSERQSTPKDGSHILSYNANALQEAGVELRHNKSKCLLDLKFSRHTLEIPQIVVDDYTELLFRNMIALEQCYYPDRAFITNYALLLDWLIDTNKDVDLLIHKKIVTNYLGDTNNVASLINGLSDNVVQSTFNSDFVNICKGLNEYCEDHWHKLKANLRHDYCRTPWQTIASIAAIVLLFLTVAQTVFSILQVVN